MIYVLVIILYPGGAVINIPGYHSFVECRAAREEIKAVLAQQSMPPMIAECFPGPTGEK